MYDVGVALFEFIGKFLVVRSGVKLFCREFNTDT